MVPRSIQPRKVQNPNPTGTIADWLRFTESAPLREVSVPSPNQKPFHIARSPFLGILFQFPSPQTKPTARVFARAARGVPHKRRLRLDPTRNPILPSLCIQATCIPGIVQPRRIRSPNMLQRLYINTYTHTYVHQFEPGPAIVSDPRHNIADKKKRVPGT